MHCTLEHPVQGASEKGVLFNNNRAFFLFKSRELQMGRWMLQFSRGVSIAKKFVKQQEQKNDHHRITENCFPLAHDTQKGKNI